MAFIPAARAAALAALLATPLALGAFTAYQIALFLLYGLVGQGIALCWGRAGFLPLGQALFFGLGAYLSGWGLKQGGGDLLVWAPYLGLAILAPAMLAGIVGQLVFSRQTGPGPYFSLITLALSMLGLQLANSWEAVTGGFNGMNGIPGLAGTDSFDTMYLVVAPLVFAVTLALERLGRSPFGLLLSAVSQDEERLQFFAFRTSALKALAFAISAALAGLAGALFAPHQGIVTPQAMGVVLSTELVVWTAVGGKGVWIGPVVGAVLMGWLTATLRDDFAYWEIVEALIFIAVVLRFPAGLAGATLGRLGSPRPRVAVTTAPAIAQALDTDLAFEGVRVRINGLRILDGLDLRLDRPGLHCMIGPNGAGKTSAFNALTGRLPLTSGALSWRGVALKGKRPHQIAALGIARKFQIPSVFPNLTVGENLVIAIWANRLPVSEMFSMKPLGWTTPRRARLVETFPFLADVDVRAGALSLGHRQMLEFAMANLMEPGLLLLDEPCAGLSSSETTEMIEAIRVSSAENGGATLIIEHDMRVVQTLANHVYVLHLGAKLAEGTMAEIRANAAVRAVYAGSEK